MKGDESKGQPKPQDKPSEDDRGSYLWELPIIAPIAFAQAVLKTEMAANIMQYGVSGVLGKPPSSEAIVEAGDYGSTKGSTSSAAAVDAKIAIDKIKSESSSSLSSSLLDSLPSVSSFTTPTRRDCTPIPDHSRKTRKKDTDDLPKTLVTSCPQKTAKSVGYGSTTSSAAGPDLDSDPEMEIEKIKRESSSSLECVSSAFLEMSSELLESSYGVSSLSSLSSLSSISRGGYSEIPDHYQQKVAVPAETPQTFSEAKTLDVSSSEPKRQTRKKNRKRKEVELDFAPDATGRAEAWEKRRLILFARVIQSDISEGKGTEAINRHFQSLLNRFSEILSDLRSLDGLSLKICQKYQFDIIEYKQDFEKFNLSIKNNLQSWQKALQHGAVQVDALVGTLTFLRVEIEKTKKQYQTALTQFVLAIKEKLPKKIAKHRAMVTNPDLQLPTNSKLIAERDSLVNLKLEEALAKINPPYNIITFLKVYKLIKQYFQDCITYRNTMVAISLPDEHKHADQKQFSQQSSLDQKDYLQKLDLLFDPELKEKVERTPNFDLRQSRQQLQVSGPEGETKSSVPYSDLMPDNMVQTAQWLGESASTLASATQKKAWGLVQWGISWTHFASISDEQSSAASSSFRSPPAGDVIQAADYTGPPLDFKHTRPIPSAFDQLPLPQRAEALLTRAGGLRSLIDSLPPLQCPHLNADDPRIRFITTFTDPIRLFKDFHKILRSHVSCKQMTEQGYQNLFDNFEHFMKFFSPRNMRFYKNAVESLNGNLTCDSVFRDERLFQTLAELLRVLKSSNRLLDNSSSSFSSAREGGLIRSGASSFASFSLAALAAPIFPRSEPLRQVDTKFVDSQNRLKKVLSLIFNNQFWTKQTKHQWLWGGINSAFGNQERIPTRVAKLQKMILQKMHTLQDFKISDPRQINFNSMRFSETDILAIQEIIRLESGAAASYYVSKFSKSSCGLFGERFKRGFFNQRTETSQQIYESLWLFDAKNHSIDRLLDSLTESKEAKQALSASS